MYGYIYNVYIYMLIYNHYIYYMYTIWFKVKSLFILVAALQP